MERLSKLWQNRLELYRGFESNYLYQWYQVLRKCRVSIASLTVVVGAFLFVPQAQDVLRSMAEPGKMGQIVAFELLLALWLFAVWYGGWFILSQDFLALRDPSVKKSEQQLRSLQGEKTLPLLLGTGCLVGIGVAMFCAVWGIRKSSLTGQMHYDRVMTVGVLNVLAGVALFLVLRYREDLLVKAGRWVRLRIRQPRLQQFVSFEKRTLRFGDLSEFTPLMRRVLFGLIVFSVVVWAAVCFSLQRSAPFFGTAAILLLSVTIITVLATALAWVGEFLHLPLLILFILIPVILSNCTDNHAVRKLDHKLPDSEWRSSARQHFRNWLEVMDKRYPTERPHPMFIVSAAGGGIKAAYWTAGVLGRMQENPAFADHAIIISSVSGGSLGSLVFADLLADGLRTPGSSYVKTAQDILSEDFLAPAMGSLLFHDLPARYIPVWLMRVPDRAMALEHAWERAWQKHGYPRTSFQREFSSLAPLVRDHRIPALIVNGTSVETGRRILTSCLKPDFCDSIDSLALLGHDIRLSTAAMMSARFTYVSPPGTVTASTHVVDGGYYENSGAMTALQFYESIEDDLDKLEEAGRVRSVFIMIDNTYRQESAQGKGFWRLLPEIMSPVNTLLQTRGAHEETAKERVRRFFGEDDLVFFNFSSAGFIKAPLGWYLSSASQEEIKGQMEKNRGNFARVDSMLGKR